MVEKMNESYFQGLQLAGQIMIENFTNSDDVIRPFVDQSWQNYDITAEVNQSNMAAAAAAAPGRHDVTGVTAVATGNQSAWNEEEYLIKMLGPRARDFRWEVVLDPFK